MILAIHGKVKDTTSVFISRVTYLWDDDRKYLGSRGYS